MGRRHDEERTRQSRTRGYGGSRGGEREGRDRDGFYGPYFTRDGERYFEDYEGNRYFSEGGPRRYDGYDDRYDDRYDRNGDRQKTKRTGLKVAGVICVALIALFGVMVLAAEDPSQTGQVPQAPQQAPGVSEAPQQAPQETPAAPETPAVPDNPASEEQVEGLRADIERQLVEIRQSINELRLQIMSWFQSSQSEQQG